MDDRLKILFDRKAVLEDRLAKAEKTHNEMEGKMQSRYDTQKEEWAFQCSLYQQQIDTVNSLINQYQSLGTVPDDIITIGSIFTIRFNDDGEPQSFILLERDGGFDLGGVKTISLQSPVGKAVNNARVGDTISKEVDGIKINLKVLSIGDWSEK